MQSLESATGVRPPTCPWRCLRDPLVAAAVEAYPFFESGQLHEWWGSDPPWILVEAVRCYHMAVRRIVDVYRKKDAPSGD